MDKRWIHPLFKPSEKTSRDIDIFSTSKRFSPKYYNQPELSPNLKFKKKKTAFNFGQSLSPSFADMLSSYRLPISATCVLLICFFSVFVLALQTKFSKQPSIYASNFVDINFSSLENIDKDSFLRKLSENHQRAINTQINYVAELIRNHRVSPHEAKSMAFIIVRESLHWGYDPLFVTAVIKSESTFRKHALSPVGAMGLMQIMPNTGRYVSQMHQVEWSGTSKLNDPHYNIKLGVAYLKYLDKMFKGDREKMLVAYNWGPANVMNALKSSKRFPSSTIKYARDIMNNHGKWNADYNQKMARFLHLNPEAIS